MTSTTANTVRHIVTFTKDAKRSLRDDVVSGNVKAITECLVSRAMSVRGWTFAPMSTNNVERTDNPSTDYEYLYKLHFVLTWTAPSESSAKPEPHELAAHLRTLHTRSAQPQQGRWTLALVDGKAYEQSTASDETVIQSDALGYAAVEIPSDFDSYFSHLYGLDPQIMRVRRAVEAGLMSEWENRYHCALVGPPGCGKSDVARSLKKALGEDAVMELDATATTAKGAIKELAEREILPRVVVIEEIEKAPEEAMSFLLAVLDQRSEIRKVTARETVVRDTKLFAIATVNNIALFEKLQAGALASRFANRIAFSRPSRAILEQILRREVAKMEDGDEAWIAPTLDYCESKGITDPRRVTSICLCGRDMLLTGEWQTLLDETSPKEEGQA